MPSRLIYGVGPSTAKLFICGEGPGKYEEERGMPFVGPSGEILDDLLEGAKIKREQIYITNVVKIRPPDNDLDRLSEIPNLETGKPYTIEDFLPLLWKEIAAIKPNCILGLGAVALKYLTGHGSIGDITNYRGSILYALDSRPTKCICSFHPASLFERPREKSSGQGVFNWKFKAIIQFDVCRAVEQSAFPEISRPIRYIKACRNSLDLSRFLEEYGINYDR